MTNEEWHTNIESVSNIVASNLGSDTLNFVFAKYGATNIEDLSESHY